MQKTHKMLAIEKQHEHPIEEVLSAHIMTMGTKRAALRLGISRSALYLWVTKLGLEVNHKATVTPRQEGTNV